MRRLLGCILIYIPYILAIEPITGFWKTVDTEGAPQCILVIYEHNDLYYGRIIGTFSDQGEFNDTLYHPTKQTFALVGDPYYSGLDIIWDLHESGNKFKGKILNPQNGSVYTAELWKEDNKLFVRGKLFIFGKTHTWYAVTDEDWPLDFPVPEPSQFVPHIPEKK